MYSISSSKYDGNQVGENEGPSYPNGKLKRRRLSIKEAGSQRITDLFHWNAINFRRYWRMSIAACLARERGRVGMRAALGDWAKRETDRMVAVGAAMH